MIHFYKIFFQIKAKQLSIFLIILFSSSFIKINLASADIMEEKFETNSNNGFFDGYNLFVLNKADASSGITEANTLYITNMSGEVFLEKPLWTNSALSNIPVEFVNSTTILFGDSNSVNLWNIYTDEILELSFTGHHEYELNPNNLTIFTLNVEIVEIDGDQYNFDILEEYDLVSGTKIWEFKTSDYISIDQFCPYNDMYMDLPDITHANSIAYDIDEDVIYLNCRNTNAFYKINHKNADLVWSLGEDGNFTMRNIKGELRDFLFFHGHALEIIGEDTFIYFDNDKHNQTNNLNMRSRMLEITIDEQTFTANTTWEWEAPYTYYSGWWGDSDRLPNLNRLGTFGTAEHAGTNRIGARLVEVNDAGNIVWEMYFPKDSGKVFGIYRAERIRLSPIIGIDEIYWIKTGTEAIINWQAWYNFRNKQYFSGNYQIFFEEQEIENGVVDFKLYWQSTNKSFNLGYLENGSYNITIVLEDEEGHNTTQYVELLVSKNPPEEPSKSNFSFIPVIPFIVLILINIKRKREGKKSTLLLFG